MATFRKTVMRADREYADFLHPLIAFFPTWLPDKFPTEQLAIIQSSLLIRNPKGLTYYDTILKDFGHLARSRSPTRRHAQQLALQAAALLNLHTLIRLDRAYSWSSLSKPYYGASFIHPFKKDFDAYLTNYYKMLGIKI